MQVKDNCITYTRVQINECNFTSPVCVRRKHEQRIDCTYLSAPDCVMCYVPQSGTNWNQERLGDTITFSFCEIWKEIRFESEYRKPHRFTCQRFFQFSSAKLGQNSLVKFPLVKLLLVNVLFGQLSSGQSSPGQCSLWSIYLDQISVGQSSLVNIQVTIEKHRVAHFR